MKRLVASHTPLELHDGVLGIRRTALAGHLAHSHAAVGQKRYGARGQMLAKRIGYKNRLTIDKRRSKAVRRAKVDTDNGHILPLLAGI